MTMTISSRHDLDQLEEWVKDKFSPIENKEVVLPNLGDPDPYPENNLGKLVKLVPVKDKDILTLFWILPYVQKDIKA
jgi:secreted Zn-dependent insulinase-like peptidase